MDRFIPNRSASNLDAASYNIALEMKDVENQNEAQSPSKVSTEGGSAGAKGPRSVHQPHKSHKPPKTK